MTTVEAFLADSRGPRILHISDTDTSLYPMAEELIRLVRPDLLIHTGDMADEFKVGRIPEHIPGYLPHVRHLLDVMKENAGEVWVVPGNNDHMPLLSAEPGIRLLTPGSRAEWQGVKFYLSHVTMGKIEDAQFALYGHGPTGDIHRPWNNPDDGVTYLNGVYFWHIIDAPTGRYVALPVRERVYK